MVRAALILGMNRKKLFILCTREVQNSIDESVYKLICDQIEEMGLDGFYNSYDQEIRGANGTRFVFAGLKNQFKKDQVLRKLSICASYSRPRHFRPGVGDVAADHPARPHRSGRSVRAPKSGASLIRN